MRVFNFFCISLFVCASLSHAVELSEIEQSFDKVSATVAEINSRIQEVNQRASTCSGYLDKLCISPNETIGKDLQSVISTGENLVMDDMDNVAEMNRSEIAQAILSDSVIQGTIKEISGEIAQIKTMINELEPQADVLKQQLVEIGTQLAGYKGSFLEKVKLVQLGFKIKSMGEDVGSLFTSFTDSLTQSGAVLKKLGVILSLLPPEDPVTIELTNALANPTVKSGAATSSSTPTSAEPSSSTQNFSSPASTISTSLAPSTPAASTQSSGLSGYWEEISPKADRLKLLLGTPAVGSTCGFLVHSAEGVQTPLTLVQSNASEQVYSTLIADLVYKVSSFQDQLILRQEKRDGTLIAQVFLKRP